MQEDAKLIHRMIWSKLLFSYTWAFFIYLSIWLISGVAFLFLLACVIDFVKPESIPAKAFDTLFMSLIWILFGFFFISFYFRIKRRIQYYEGRVIEKKCEELEGEMGTFYRYFIDLKDEKATHHLRLDYEAYSKLEEGSMIELYYERTIADAWKIFLK